MSGPLHGGAPSRVLHMIEEVEKTGDATAYVKGLLDRSIVYFHCTPHA